MAQAKSDDASERRFWRHEVRRVARLLRFSGLTLVLVGVGGLVLGASGDWWIAPSWFSLAIGVALLLAAIVQRVRQRRGRTNGLPES